MGFIRLGSYSLSALTSLYFLCEPARHWKPIKDAAQLSVVPCGAFLIQDFSIAQRESLVYSKINSSWSFDSSLSTVLALQGCNSRFNAQNWSSVDRFQQFSFPLVFRVKFCYRLFDNHFLGRAKAETRRLRTSMDGKRSTLSNSGSSESALVWKDHVFIGRGNRTTRVRFVVEDFGAFTRDKVIFCSVLSDRRRHILLFGL